MAQRRYLSSITQTGEAAENIALDHLVHAQILAFPVVPRRAHRKRIRPMANLVGKVPDASRKARRVVEGKVA